MELQCVCVYERATAVRMGALAEHMTNNRRQTHDTSTRHPIRNNNTQQQHTHTHRTKRKVDGIAGEDEEEINICYVDWDATNEQFILEDDTKADWPVVWGFWWGGAGW